MQSTIVLQLQEQFQLAISWHGCLITNINSMLMDLLQSLMRRTLWHTDFRRKFWQCAHWKEQSSRIHEQSVSHAFLLNESVTLASCRTVTLASALDCQQDRVSSSQELAGPCRELAGTAIVQQMKFCLAQFSPKFGLAAPRGEIRLKATNSVRYCSTISQGCVRNRDHGAPHSFEVYDICLIGVPHPEFVS